jgi:hypothetical protein
MTSSEIYPQMMRHHSGQGGLAHVPMPSEPAIMRAAIELGRSHGPGSSQEVHGVRSANVLIDQRSPPASPIRLMLMQPVNVHVVTRRIDLARIEILDELDVIVARSVRDTEDPRRRSRARPLSSAHHHAGRSRRTRCAVHRRRQAARDPDRLKRLVGSKGDVDPRDCARHSLRFAKSTSAQPD